MMQFTMACLLVTIGVFAGVCLHLSARIDDERIKREIQKMTIDHLVKRVNLNQECIELQTKCIKDLNGIVKRTVKDKETAEPDTKVLISGWDADDPEESELLSDIEARTRMAVMDMLQCQNLNPQQGIIDNLNCRNIYPWQTGQLQLCATHPLWYINRRLEDM